MVSKAGTNLNAVSLYGNGLFLSVSKQEITDFAPNNDDFLHF